MDIKNFITKNSNNSIIAVQGLGFVGSVMSLVCANALSADYLVIGIDVPEMDQKIQLLNNGVFPLVAEDPKIELYFNNALKKGNFFATSDSSSFSYADVIIVDINLDVKKTKNKDESLNSFDVDLNSFKDAIRTIGTYCKDDSLVLVETTVPPGTCNKIVAPILHEKLSDRGLTTTKIKIAHSYERVMPGPGYIDSIQNYPRVYAGIDEKSADAAECFLKSIIDTSKCTLTRLSNTTATEMAKVLENSYRATNIAFAVEWSRFAEEAGVDLWSIVDAIRVRKTHANLMYPNIGVGGYCLTKDPLLASWSRKNLFGSETDLEVSINSVSINDQMPIFAYQRLKSLFGPLENLKVVLFGVSYRGDVGDTRFSPVEPIFRLLKTHSCEIKIHDPYVSKWHELEINVSSEIDDILLDNPDLIIISTAHTAYKSDLFVSKLIKLDNCKIFDTVGLFSKKQILSLKDKHKISILGSGETI
jgi:UDP-N-acetyl-D-glucosamine dehydrogenase